MFQPLFKDKKRKPEYLAYIEPLKPALGSTKREGQREVHVPEESSGLYKLTRLLDPDGSRCGLVVSLKDIWRPIDIVPVFGKVCPRNWTTENSIELAGEFYMNPFYDKFTYWSLCI